MSGYFVDKKDCSHHTVFAGVALDVFHPIREDYR